MMCYLGNPYYDPITSNITISQEISIFLDLRLGCYAENKNLTCRPISDDFGLPSVDAAVSTSVNARVDRILSGNGVAPGPPA